MPRRDNPPFVNLLSIVVPAYKQEKTIIKDIKNIQRALKEIGYKYEIVVVVDGTTDKTFEKVKKIILPLYARIIIVPR